jgi:hypothetical protein
MVSCSHHPWGSELARLVENTDTAKEVSGRPMDRALLLTEQWEHLTVLSHSLSIWTGSTGPWLEPEME